MREGENRRENPRSGALRGRVLELWQRGDISTDRIAAATGLDEAEVCRMGQEWESAQC